MSENVILYQNNPNPFNPITGIGYRIPETINTAFLYIYDMNGTQQKFIPIQTKGNGTVTINGSILQPGMYMYTLIVDGKEVDTKKMILTEWRFIIVPCDLLRLINKLHGILMSIR